MYKLIKGFLEGLRPEPLLSVSTWSDEHRYLSTEASAEPGRWRTDRTPYLREILDKLSTLDVTEEVIVMKGAQLGFALDVKTLIPTPSGWTTMGEIQVGDKVFDEQGNSCTVTFVTDVMNNHRCFDVFFSDGSIIRADAEHRWSVFDDKDKRKVKTLKTLFTADIADTFKYRGIRNRYAVPVTKPIDCREIELSIPPYTLGVWLGDGNSHSNRVTTCKDDAEEMLSYILKEGIYAEIESKHSKGNCTEIVFKPHPNICSRGHSYEKYGKTSQGFCKECNRLISINKPRPKKINYKFGDLMEKEGLYRNKHIPLKYLRSSVSQRFSLLQGLMDTDGHVTKEGYCEFYSCDKNLIDDVFELICSLGYKPKIRFKDTFGKEMSIDGKRFYKMNGLYVITFASYSERPVFRLSRKFSRLKSENKSRATEINTRRIVDVKEVESVPVKCITVDSPSHLYLAGKSMIPTHNTEAGFNFVGYVMDIAPGPILYVLPTVEVSKRNSKTRLDPMIEATPRLKAKIAPAKSRDSGNTTLMKEFPGGALVMGGANSAATLRNMPVRYLILDEVDAYPIDLDGEGSPIDLAVKRTATFSRKKIYKLSTPSHDETSVIKREFEGTDQRFFFVPCPHCGATQHLKFERLRWEKKDYKTVRYECEHCEERIEERFKTRMLAKGQWTPTKPENTTPRKVGYHINSLYSPYGWYSWQDAAREWDEAQEDVNKLKVFVNTVLGETYKESADSPQWENLYNRREAYTTNKLPADVCFLTAGVDIQGNRIELEIVGWCKGRRTYSIDYRVLLGDTTKPEVWEELSKVVSEQWEHADGGAMPLSMMAVDSGFNTTHVYDFCMKFDYTRVIPMKGKDTLNNILVSPPRAVHIMRNGKKMEGMKVWHVNTGMIKSEFYGFLRLEQKEDNSYPDGYCHFPEYDRHYFRMLTAEELRMSLDRKGFRKYEWHKKYERNEALDCRVYARAAAAVLNIDLFRDEHYEQMRGMRRAIQKNEPQEPKQKKPQKRNSFWDR